MNNDIKIIECPFCKFSIWTIPNERLALCKHCRQIVDIGICEILDKHNTKKDSR